MLATYDSKVFKDLNELDEARNRFLDKNAERYLTVLGEIVYRYDLQDVVGITMAHRHFRIEEDEQLIEELK